VQGKVDIRGLIGIGSIKLGQGDSYYREREIVDENRLAGRMLRSAKSLLTEGVADDSYAGSARPVVVRG
jgi:hypothetical protein